MHSFRNISASNPKHILTAPGMRFCITLTYGLTRNNRDLFVYMVTFLYFILLHIQLDTGYMYQYTYRCGFTFLCQVSRNKTSVDS